MTDESDESLDEALLSMAEFDRQELRVELAEIDPSMAPLGPQRAEQILASVEAVSRPRVTRASRRGRLGVAIGASAAAAALLVWGWGSLASNTPHVGPMTIQLGGTSRILGSHDPEPRAYGPGDDFVLRLVPRDWDARDVPARLTARSSAGEVQPLDWQSTTAADGAIEFRGRLDAVLSPGVWVLSAEVGRFEACEAPEPATRGQCSAMEAKVELVSD